MSKLTQNTFSSYFIYSYYIKLVDFLNDEIILTQCFLKFSQLFNEILSQIPK